MDSFDWASPLFPYSYAELNSMNRSTIASSAVTILFGILILLFYSYLSSRDRSNADRVSLRCVVYASFTNIVSCAFNIAMCFIPSTRISCHVLDILFDFLDVLSTGLLSVVGINLVLIFVIKVKPTKPLERYYYSCIMVYSLLLIILPVYEMVVSDQFKDREYHSCWFFSNIGKRNNNPSSWMYFYCLIFFITLVGLASSLIAVTKLMRSHYQSSIMMQACNGYRGRTSMTDRRFSHSPTMTRVILRCIIYSMVPFITHTCGFAVEILVLSEMAVPYKLMVLSNVLTYLEGTITAGVFFTEPAVCAFIRTTWKKWYQTYVEDFRIVVSTERRRSSSTLLSFSSNGVTNKLGVRMQPRPATTRDMRCAPPDADDTNAEVLRVPSPPSNEDIYTTRAVPMRRVSVNQSMGCSSLNNQARRQSRSDSIASSLTVSRGDTRENVVFFPNTTDEVYIPYRFPILASAAHYVFTSFSRKKNDHRRQEPPIVFQDTNLEEQHLPDSQLDSSSIPSL